MAHIEVWHQCPVCDRWYDTKRKAERCRNQHPVREARWARGKHKDVRIMGNTTPNSMYGEQWALREADLSDFIPERERQLAQLASAAEEQQKKESNDE